MSESAADKPPLPLDEVAAAGLALAAEPDLAGVGRRLRERLESWAAPSLVLCIERDADGGWRTVPELSSGTASAGVERTLARMIEEAPAGTLSRPTLLRTEVTAANVRPRDNVIVPWSWAGASGYLVLRGVPRPSPANLAEAVALACLPVWPLLRAAPPAPAAPAAASAAGTGAADAGRQELEALGRKNAALQKARAAAEEERDRAESEAAELRDRVEALERQFERSEAERRVLDASREAAARSDAALLASRLHELDAARRELDGVRQELEAVRNDRAQGLEHAGTAEAEQGALREKLEAAGADRAALERERDQARAECGALSASLESLERRLSDERRRFEAESASAAEERTAAATAGEERLREAREEERTALQAELARLRSENNMLYASIESWERQLREQAARFETEKQGLTERSAQLERRAAEADEQRAAADAARSAAEGELGPVTERATQAEAARSELAERWDNAVASFRAALDALRRTPFVPPTLRVSMAGAQGAVGPEAAAPATHTGIRVLLLDRDTPGLDALAGDLEQAGHEVLVAHYPEEVSFFLKTSEAKRLAAAVCDVMAFRGDSDLIEAFRTWRHDLPGVALFLSFKADNPSEAERARRVPSVLTAGYLKRPLVSGPLLESLTTLGRRGATRT